VDAHRGNAKRFIVRADETNRVHGTGKGDTQVRGEFDIVTGRAETCVPMKS
jgi:hypothetical protein